MEKSGLGDYDSLVVIVGAGASAAIDPTNIPTMNNFFEIADNISAKVPQIRKTLSTLKKYSLIGDKFPYKANLEAVLKATMKLPRDNSDPWKRPYDGLLLTMHAVLKYGEKANTVDKYAECISPLTSIHPSRITFVSFNYDLFLERALYELFGWMPDVGYPQNVIVGAIDATQAERAEHPDAICDEKYAWNIIRPAQSPPMPVVLKPHGSFNWFIHGSENPYSWISDMARGFLLMTKCNFDKSKVGLSVEEGPVSIPEHWIFSTTNTVKGEIEGKEFDVGSILPAIIPPMPIKEYHSVFQKIRERIKDDLINCSAIIIIGWNMSDLDSDSQELIRQAMDKRTKELKLLGICDFRQDDSFYDRFKKLIESENFERCNSGFLTNDSKTLLRKIVDYF